MRTILRACSVLLVMVGASQAAPWMTVTSTSIRDGQVIPVRYGADDAQRACSPRNPAICPCPGANVSPQLAWHDTPAGTRSLAILMYDIDGQYGAGVSHWVAYNIDPGRGELKEGEATAGAGFTGGRGTRGNANYLGPCPPQGDGHHHYLITVMAMDLEPGLAAGLTREQFLEAARGHLLASATIGGLFARSYR